MRVSRLSVELPGTPGRGFPVHAPKHVYGCTSKLHQLHRPRSCSPSTTPSTPVGRNVSRRYAHQAPPLNGHVSHFGHGAPAPNIDHRRSRYDADLTRLLAALRQREILQLYFCLLDLTQGANERDLDFVDVVQRIPATTFSEILRCFDPVHVASHVDSAPGMRISYGTAVFTDLGELINKWGVKIIYVQIFNRLRLIQRARRLSHDARSQPLLNDYAILLRCAGAISNIPAAKLVWHEMKEDGFADWNHGHYPDFLKARYLTERHYVNNDLSRLRLRPLDMYRSSISLPSRVVRKLKGLSGSYISSNTHRFGQNPNQVYFAEPLTRLLRGRKPILRLLRKLTVRNMLRIDEQLCCVVLKANGRMGRTKSSLELLRALWNIRVLRDDESGAHHVEGGADFPPGSAQAPTDSLLDAVVHCFGNMGELRLALKLVDFISRRWSIPVPDSVWSDLLDFSRIKQTKLAVTELRAARFDSKTTRPEMTLSIWNLCTEEPHNFKPGMRDYSNLTQAFIGSHKSLGRPLEALRHIKPLYDEAVRKMQDAWLELVLTTRQGVPNHSAYRKYRVAQSRKSYMWYCIHYAVKQMIKHHHPSKADDPSTVRHIPDLIKEFAPFIGEKIKYATATGQVTFGNDRSRSNFTVTGQLVHRPRVSCGLPPSVNIELSRRRREVDNVTATQDTSSKSRDHQGGAPVGPPELYAPLQRTSILQIVDRPARLVRPRWSSPNDELTASGLLADGKLFTGYHDDPLKEPFAAHRVLRWTFRNIAMPPNLLEGDPKGLLKQALWIRA